VILVGDDASIRRALRTRLLALEFNLLVCESAEELLASEFPPGAACLLRDVWMPGMNGIELCRSLATTGRELPTIMMRGVGDERTTEISAERSRLPAIKPFDQKQLTRAIRKALGNG
jgi:FixJ family two-component response regulator